VNPGRIQLKLVAAVVAAAGVGYLGANLMPVVNVALLAEAAYDERAVGLLGSFELAAVALGCLLLAPWIARISRRKLATVGALVAGCGFAIAAASETFAAIAIGRLVAGAGGGVALGAANATVASAEDPDRTFALTYLVGGFIASVLLAILPQAIEVGGYPAAFASLAGLCVMSIPFFVWLPRAYSAGARPVRSGASVSLAAALLLGAAFLYSVTEQGLYAFSGEIGVRVGLPLDTVGPVIGAMMLAGLIGSGVASWLSTRLGRTLPIAAGFCLSALSRWGVVHASSTSEYVVMSILWGFAFFFLLPYMMGAAAALDPGGRWTTVVGAVLMLGYAVGPGTAGIVVTNLGYPIFGVFVVIFTLGGLALILPISLSMDRSARAVVPARPTAN
jgi:predicted MFS family arabinose efflux permease